MANDLTKVKGITIYGRPNCQWCTAAGEFLERRNIDYQYIDLTNTTMVKPEEARALIAKSGMRSVPIIYNGDDLIGGFKELEKLSFE